MKRLLWLVLGLLPCTLFADSWQNAQSISKGNYVESYVVSVNTTTQTQIVNPALAILSSHIVIFSSAATTNNICIGTNTATLMTTGFPVTPLATYTIDGTYTGSLYAMGTAGQSTSTVRVLYWLKNDALR